MQKLSRFSTHNEAHIITQALRANGIHAELLGSRAYASHYLGGDTGTYDIYVQESDYQAAIKFINSTKLRVADEESTSIQKPSQYYLKKSIIHAFFAMFIAPVICNYISLINLNLFLKIETNKVKKIVYGFVILLLQLPPFILLYIILYPEFT